MKEMDCVEVTVEKEEYARYGVHKGMQGKTHYKASNADRWYVRFPNCNSKLNEIRESIYAKDLKLLPDGINPKINEEIRRKFGEFIVGDGFCEMDCIEVIVEKEKYAKEGVHKGMQGWICQNGYGDGYWEVNLPQCYDKPDIATLAIHEDDMIQIPVMHAKINEEIKKKFGD